MNRTFDWINATPDKIGIEHIGFVYEIVEIDTGMKYVGIKRFRKRIKYPPLKGNKNKRIKYVESDWKTYNSSNKELQERIKNNPHNYHKLIIKLCETITDMKAWEAYTQLDFYISGEWDKLYNEVINSEWRELNQN